MSGKDFAKVLGLVTAVGTLVGVVAHKMGKDSKAIEDAVKNLAGKTSVDVENEIIEKAVTKAAEDAAEKAIKNVERDIHSQIRAGVDKVYSNVLSTIGDDFAKKAKESIDMNRFTNDVEQKAAQLVLKEFKGKLDSYTNSLFNYATSGVKITL